MAPSQRRSASALASALLLLALARPAASQGGCTPTTVTAPDIRTECVALRTIYGFLGRQPSSWAGAIAAGSSYCSYPGVTCATVSGENRVVGLYLDNNGLQGLIPPYIGNLLLLNEINLSNNNFTGQIPLSLGRLTSLTNLDLRVRESTEEIACSLRSSSFFLCLDLCGTLVIFDVIRLLLLMATCNPSTSLDLIPPINCPSSIQSSLRSTTPSRAPSPPPWASARRSRRSTWTITRSGAPCRPP